MMLNSPPYDRASEDRGSRDRRPRRSHSRRRLAILLGSSAFLLVLILLCVGPWPTYGVTDLDTSPSFRQALAAIDRSAAESHLTADPAPLIAGWAEMPLIVPPGGPMAGYGDRQGKPATGLHDPLDIGALVLGDGVDAAVIVTADLLIVPQNVAERVRSRVDQQLSLTASQILFSASHTHSGPGGFAPGWVGEQFAGAYDEEIVELLTATMVAVIQQAWENRGPARLAQGKTAVPGLVANRAHPGAAVDPDLQVLRVEKEDGASCTLVSYAAHATVLPAGNMELSAGYPGALERAIERQEGATAMFLAGAVGSMEPVTSATSEASVAGSFEAAEGLGRLLAGKVEDVVADLVYRERLDIASSGAAFDMPPFQVRLNRYLRLSPWLVPRLGVDNRAWLNGLRIGDAILVGTPSDFSGELSIELKAWAAERGIDLWLLSFNGDYIGYVSPDRYYETASRSGREGYEMYTMSWCGPQQAEVLVRLIRRLVEDLSTGP